jgi:hypothetical protein
MPATFGTARETVNLGGPAIRRSSMRRLAIVTAALILLSVCGPTPAPSPTETPAESPKPTETVTATPPANPVAEPLSIPDCETLLPIALAKSSFSESTEFLGETVPTEYYPWYQLSAVNAAIAGVTIARSCWWGIPNSDGAFSLLVAEIDPATRASVEAALTAEGFSSVEMGTLTARENGREGEVGYEAETHLFTGSVWILADDGDLSVSGIVAGSALDALRSANPTLGL